MRSHLPPLPWLRWPIALWTTLLFAAFSHPLCAQDSLELFEKQVRPLLLERCASCHGAKEPEGDLRLDQAEGLAIGSRSGPVLVPGKPQESLLWLAVSGESPDLQMPPPPHQPLTHAQKRSIQQWLASGAALPVTAPTTDPTGNSSTDLADSPASDLWSLQPIDLPGLPDAADDWSQEPIDRFVADRWPENHLPVAPADRSAWLRRVTIDLTGLLPTLEETERFLADPAPDAMERVVDRLLASPSYGPRWGRHWLDVVRYSDSNGLDENIAHGNAWRYRNYVVAARNADMPYDQFLAEQLAGDLLPPDPNDPYRRKIATGMLVLGPKVLAEVDERKMEMDIVDEQIDTVGKAVLGLTLGCARCHDHKFDPWSMEDYYRLAGIFKSTRTMEHFTKIAKWNEAEIPTPEEVARRDTHQQELASHRDRIAMARQEAIDRWKQSLATDMPVPEDPEPMLPEADRQMLQKLRDELKELEKKVPEISTAMAVSEGKIDDVPIHIRGSHLALGKKVARGFLAPVPLPAPQIAPQQSGRAALVAWLTDPEHPLTSRVIVNRIWRWHFGQGLVRSVDNFGELGESPTHPQLLDWMARNFQRDGWSWKKVQRQIVLSATYRQSSSATLADLQADPENRWLTRFPKRRMEAEAIRDCLLQAGDRLDVGVKTSYLHVKNREFFFDHTSIDKTDYNHPCRSIYLPVVRNHLYDLFQLFDYSDAAVVLGHRDTTNVPTQALCLMNSALAIDSSQGMAQRILALDGTDAQRFALALRLALQREATAEETAMACRMLDEASQRGIDSLGAWSLLCQGLLASNEFLFLP